MLYYQANFKKKKSVQLMEMETASDVSYRFFFFFFIVEFDFLPESKDEVCLKHAHLR